MNSDNNNNNSNNNSNNNNHYTTPHCTTTNTTATKTTTVTVQLQSQLQLQLHCAACSYWSAHQLVRCTIHRSQQRTSPTGSLSIKLPPPPCAVLLVGIYLQSSHSHIYMFIYYIKSINQHTFIIIYNHIISQRYFANISPLFLYLFTQ